MIEFSLVQIARYTCTEMLMAYGLFCMFLYVSLTFATRTRQPRSPRRAEQPHPYTARMAQARATAQAESTRTR